MNANELADNLIPFATDYKISNLDCMILSDAITMLRQQQAEIEALNQRIERMVEDRSKYEALAHAGGVEAGRELTDDEILTLWSQKINLNGAQDIVDFAREILIKAQSNCNGFCGEYECKENQGNCKRKAQ